jgi:MFS family permease
VTPGHSTASYRALLALPAMSGIVASLFLSRIAQSMTGVALTLFTLAEFGSASLAGLVAFASFAPGILASPIAGALLDRHGRVRLIGIDFAVAGLASVAIGVLALTGRLTAELLVAIAVLSSLTTPLSMTGLRSLFPLVVPDRLWERANALDSNAFVVSTMFGPMLAAATITVAGPPLAMVLLGLPYAFAIVALRGVRAPADAPDAEGPILRSAWAGMRYVWRNATLRGLAISVSVKTFSGGLVSIAVPIIVLHQLGGSELAVGLALGVSGLAGMISAMILGRIDSRGRELRLLVLPMLLTAPVLLLLLVPAGQLGTSQPLLGFAVLCLGLLFVGLLEGPMDIGLFTIRQRRTDIVWIGRAFAISMAANAMGYPIGAAVGGAMAETSLETVVLLSVVVCLVAAVLASRFVPRDDPSPVRSELPEGARLATEA